MLVTSLKLSLLLLLALICSAFKGCGPDVKIHDLTLCSVAGQVSNGADCVSTLTQNTTEINLSELVEFLEPNDKRGGALCMSAHDWVKAKTQIEQACALLKRCSPETKDLIKTIEGMAVTNE